MREHFGRFEEVVGDSDSHPDNERHDPLAIVRNRARDQVDIPSFVNKHRIEYIEVQNRNEANGRGVSKEGGQQTCVNKMWGSQMCVCCEWGSVMDAGWVDGSREVCSGVRGWYSRQCAKVVAHVYQYPLRGGVEGGYDGVQVLAVPLNFSREFVAPDHVV